MPGLNTKDNTIIVESLFRETTRNGKHTIRVVSLALTRNLLMIASSHSYGVSTPRQNSDSRNFLEVRSLHPLNKTNLSIFKKSQRQVLKLIFHNKYVRYFEVEKSCSTDAMWALWCKNVLQLKQINVIKHHSTESLDKSTSYDLSIINKKWQKKKIIWNDKYLYLGSKRELEDSSRPVPVAGLGPAEDIKLLCLKPQYFGCWDQSEHWVQCESSKLLR